MGSKVMNVQVYRGDRPAEQFRARIAEAMRAYVLREPMAELPPSADWRGSDLQVIVGPADPEPWVAVYDETTRGHTNREVAQYLSKELSTIAIGVGINDGDVLILDYFRDGRLVDQFDNMPDYPVESTPRRLKAYAGKPERWAGLLVEGKTPDDLRRLFERRPIDMVESLIDLGELIGLNPDRCAAGEQELHDLPVTRLLFKSTLPAPWDDLPGGPPRLALGTQTLVDTVFVGETFNLMHVLTNYGGPGTGISVVAWGPAIDEGLVGPESVELTTIEMATGRMDSDLRAFERRPSTLEGHTIETSAADFPGQAIRQGIPRVDSAMLAGVTTMRQQMRISQMQFTPQLRVMLKFRPLKEGRANLMIGYVPAENPQEGQTGVQLPLTAEHKPRTPLRMGADAPAGKPQRAMLDASAALAWARKLETPRTLIGMASLSADRAACARIAAAAFERWSRVIAPGGKGSYDVHVATDPLQHGRRHKLKVKDIPAGAAWQTDPALLATCEHLYAALPTGLLPDSGAPIPLTSGFMLEASSMSYRYGSERVAVQLAFWLCLGWPKAPDPELAQRELAAILDGLLADGAGYQGFIARWDWEPRILTTTLYEQVSGIRNPGTASHLWCSRFLRAVSERLWLGPDLLARLGDTGALAALGSLTPVGKGLRFELAAGASLDALEKALSPLLATPEDDQGMFRRMYSRAPRAGA